MAIFHLAVGIEQILRRFSSPMRCCCGPLPYAPDRLVLIDLRGGLGHRQQPGLLAEIQQVSASQRSFEPRRRLLLKAHRARRSGQPCAGVTWNFFDTWLHMSASRSFRPEENKGAATM